MKEILKTITKSVVLAFMLKAMVVVILYMLFTLPLGGAIFEGKSIDKKHYSCEIRLAGVEKGMILKADVVFLKKKAHLYIDQTQRLPLRFQNAPYFILHLDKEEIKNPSRMWLQEWHCPEKKIDWKIINNWFMSLKI